MTEQGTDTTTRRRRFVSWRVGAVVAVVIVAAMLGALLAVAVGATDDESSSDQPVSLLFSLSGSDASFTPVAGTTDRYTFSVRIADPTITWFTDRPVRQAGVTNPKWFADQWATGEQFDVDPPNAAVVLHDSSGETRTVVVSILSLRADPATRTFTGEVGRLSAAQAKKLQTNLALTGAVEDPTGGAQKLGNVTVFVDPLVGYLPPSPTPSTPVVITTTSLPGGMANDKYSATLAASGGHPPYFWWLDTWTLPGGLSLNSDGTITGTITTCGTNTFTVTAQDSWYATAKATLKISVIPEGNIPCTYNNY
ncbi:MAG: hypothetical protein FGM58_11225 [Acidimicrobiia bacterium]|nr:hypothetical protein [Acidimicrobiia bacterium]